MAGYVPHEGYEDYRFSLVAIKSYLLAKRFPRIESSDLLAGVEHVYIQSAWKLAPASKVNLTGGPHPYEHSRGLCRFHAEPACPSRADGDFIRPKFVEHLCSLIEADGFIPSYSSTDYKFTAKGMAVDARSWDEPFAKLTSLRQ